MSCRLNVGGMVWDCGMEDSFESRTGVTLRAASILFRLLCQRQGV